MKSYGKKFFVFSCLKISFSLFGLAIALEKPIDEIAIVEHPPLIHAPLSIGDLVDKITILQVKLKKLDDPVKKSNASFELEQLKKIMKEYVRITKQFEKLMKELHAINHKLWEIEDAIRAKEAKKEFDQEFITLARNVYINNGKRHELKRAINLLTNSRIIEEKQYTEYYA